jgi:hypothetical protein
METLLEWVRKTLPMDMDTSLMIEKKILTMMEEERAWIEDIYSEALAEGLEYGEKIGRTSTETAIKIIDRIEENLKNQKR